MRQKSGISKTVLVLCATILLLAGCKDTDDDSSVIPNGTYTDNYGGSNTFTDSQWSDAYGATFSVVKTNRSDNYVIYQNSASNSYNPSKFSRVDFVEDSNSVLYYCQIAYDKDTAAEAEAVTTADRSDPANSGCSGFSWTKLTKSQ